MNESLSDKIPRKAIPIPATIKAKRPLSTKAEIIAVKAIQQKANGIIKIQMRSSSSSDGRG